MCDVMILSMIGQSINQSFICSVNTSNSKKFTWATHARLVWALTAA